MKHETISFKNGNMDVWVSGNLIYCKVYGEFTDADALLVTKWLENWFIEVNGPTIRIYDVRNIRPKKFMLTSEGIDQLSKWAEKMKKKWPGSVAYFIVDKPLIFGMSRMYELKTSDERMPVHVVNTIDDLPENIKKRLPQKELQVVI